MFNKPKADLTSWRFLVIALLIGSCFCLSGCKYEKFDLYIQAGEYQGEYWPTSGWKTCSPNQVGVNAGQLFRAFEYAQTPKYNTHGLVIIKDGYIIGEHYSDGYNQSSTFSSYSVAKSFLSALIGIAVDEGKISGLNDPVKNYLTQWNEPGVDDNKKNMTIRDLLVMSSGIQWEEDYSNPENDIRKMSMNGDYLQYMLNKEMENAPLSVWEYNTGNSILLSGILKAATGQTAYKYGREKLFDKTGIDKLSWKADWKGLTIGGWGIKTSVRNYAKFGYLFLRKGIWDGEQLVPSSWVKQSTVNFSEDTRFYGFHWWVLKGFRNFSGSDLPEDIFLAIGIHGQIVYVLPQYNMLIAKSSFHTDPLNEGWDHVHFLTLIKNSIE